MNKLFHKTDSKNKGATCCVRFFYFLFPVIVFLFNIQFSQAASWVSIKQGNWSDPTVWDCNCNPASTDNISIDFPVTLDIAATCANLEIKPANSTGVFTLSGSNTLHATGNLSITNGGTLNVNGTAALSVDGTATGSVTSNTINISTGTVSFTKAAAWTWANKINVNVTSTGSMSVSSAAFTLNNASNLSVTGAGGSIIFSGTVTESNAQSVITMTAAGTLTFNGLVTHSNGTLSNTGNAGTINFNAGYTNSGGGSNFISMAGETINFGGDFTSNTTPIIFDPASTAVFNANAPNIIPNTAITFGNFQINSGITAALQGDISVVGNWTNNGGTFTPNAKTVTFSGASGSTQSISKSGGETFYIITTTAGATIQLLSGVTITNTLNMNSNINLNGYTLTLGSGASAILAQTAGTIAYGGTWKRYWPAGAISSSGSPNLGTFPLGSATYSRPITVNSNTNSTGAGYISAYHTDANTVTDVNLTDNGTTVVRISDQQFTITNSGVTGGTYVVDMTFSFFASTGALSDMKLVSTLGNTTTGTVVNPSTGTVGTPIGHRGSAASYLSLADFINTWALGTINKVATPLQVVLYSTNQGGTSNWNQGTTWSYTSGGAGTNCGCTPNNTSDVYISSGQTITVNAAGMTARDVTVLTGATLTGANTLTVSYDLTTAGTGIITPSGAWTISGNMTTAGTGNSTISAALVVSQKLTVGSGTTVTMSGGVALTVSGDLQVNGTLALGTSTATLNTSGAIISGTGSITGSGSLAVSNNKTIASGTVLTIAPTFAISGTAVVTNNGTITLSGDITGTVLGSNWTNAANSTLTIAGTLLATGTLYASAGGNTVNYNSSGNQTIKVPAGASFPYDNLKCSNGGTKTMGGTAISVIGTLTVQDATILDESTNVISGAGGLTMTGTSELKLQRGASATYPELTGGYALTGGTVTINQTGNTCTVRGATYYNLNFTGSRPYDMSLVSNITNNFTIQGSSTMTNNFTLTVGNAFTYSSSGSSTLANDVNTGSYTQAGGTLTDGGKIIAISGAGGWSKSGGTYSATGTVKLIGSVAQTIGNNAGETYYNLIIANTSGGVSFAGTTNVTVTNQLTFTSGVVTTGANTLILSKTTAASLVYTDGFVYGTLRRYIASNASTYLFPVGDGTASTDQHRIAFVNNSITGVTYLDASITDFTQSAPNNDAALTTTQSLTQIISTIGSAAGQTDMWTLTPNAAPTGGSYGVRLYVENTTLTAAADNMFCPLKRDASSVTYADFLTLDGSTTIPATGAAGRIYSAGAGYAQRTGYTSFSHFVIGKGVWPLPIELLAFDAKPDGNIVNVTWSTATEFNNDYFVVQRSKDGRDFSDVTRVRGAGNSSTTRNYSSEDYEPYSGVSYYRLKQVDYDGKFSYSSIVAVQFHNEDAMSVYPNPAAQGEVFNVSISGQNGKEVLVVVHDVQGREFYSKINIIASDTEVIAIDPSGKLAAGIYMVVATSNDAIYQKKVVIK